MPTGHLKHAAPTARHLEHLAGDGVRSLAQRLRGGLLSYYPLSDNADSVGGVNLTALNTPVFGAGKIGNGFIVAASTNKGFSRSGTVVNLTADFTIWGWFKTNGADFALIFDMYDGANGWAVYNVPGVGLKAEFFNPPTSGLSAGNTYGDNAWHFASARFQLSTRAIRVTTETEGFGIAVGSAFVTPSSSLGIGNRANNLAFSTSMDEVGISSRYLSDAEIAYLINGGAGRTYPF